MERDARHVYSTVSKTLLLIVISPRHDIVRFKNVGLCRTSVKLKIGYRKSEIVFELVTDDVWAIKYCCHAITSKRYIRHCFVRVTFAGRSSNGSVAIFSNLSTDVII